MEIIDVSGYTIEEKLEISHNYLVPRQITENGIKPEIIEFDAKTIEKIIMNYTAESGVRNLERSIASVCRQVAYEYAISSD
jgi:ATP-dependent Lon protease